MTSRDLPSLWAAFSDSDLEIIRRAFACDDGIEYGLPDDEDLWDREHQLWAAVEDEQQRRRDLPSQSSSS